MSRALGKTPERPGRHDAARRRGRVEGLSPIGFVNAPRAPLLRGAFPPAGGASSARSPPGCRRVRHGTISASPSAGEPCLPEPLMATSSEPSVRARVLVVAPEPFYED